jgi:hypothetical protein
MVQPEMQAECTAVVHCHNFSHSKLFSSPTTLHTTYFIAYYVVLKQKLVKRIIRDACILYAEYFHNAHNLTTYQLPVLSTSLVKIIQPHLF